MNRSADSIISLEDVNMRSCSELLRLAADERTERPLPEEGGNLFNGLLFGELVALEVSVL